MTDRRTLGRRIPFATLALAVVATAASAKDAASNPIPLYLQGLDVAPGVEHRLVILHPILAQPREVKRGEELAVGGAATSELLALGEIEKSAPPRVEAVSFTTGPAALFAGDVVRTDVADFAVARDVVLPGGAPVSTPVVRVSRTAPPDPSVLGTTMLGPVLPSAIRFLVLADAPPQEIRDVCGKWADDVRLADARLSPADLPRAESVKKRVADYRKSLGDALKRPPTGGREVVGCAVLFEGAVASFETFADGKSFAAVWPRLLDAIAAEAVVLEARGRSLENDIPDPADPDRFLADLKARLLGVYGARPVERDVRASGRNIDLSLDGASAQALVLGDDRVVHFVLVTDPARRNSKRPTEDPDLNAASRKPRPTEEEKRLLDRRNGGSAAPPPPEPPPPPPTPK